MITVFVLYDIFLTIIISIGTFPISKIIKEKTSDEDYLSMVGTNILPDIYHLSSLILLGQYIDL